MSDPTERDLSAPRETSGRARASLSQIRAMYGRVELDGERLVRTGMYGRREVWRRISGTGGNTIYEVEGGS